MTKDNQFTLTFAQDCFEVGDVIRSNSGKLIIIKAPNRKWYIRLYNWIMRKIGLYRAIIRKKSTESGNFVYTVKSIK
jgi:hypothetical protein